jgi:transposase-like protein
VRRGLTGERLEMLCVDGGSGLLAALPMAFSDVPVQRCWAHKSRNVLNKVRKPDQVAVKADLPRIMDAASLPAALSAARRFADRWEAVYPKAVACLRADLDDLLTCFRYLSLAERRAVRTTNAIERRFREVPAPHPPDGHLPGPHLDGTHPVRRVHPRKPQPGPRHPLRPDTNLLTLPPRGDRRGPASW